jgi:hypothetical protein
MVQHPRKQPTLLVAVRTLNLTWFACLTIYFIKFFWWHSVFIVCLFVKEDLIFFLICYTLFNLIISFIFKPFFWQNFLLLSASSTSLHIIVLIFFQSSSVCSLGGTVHNHSNIYFIFIQLYRKIKTENDYCHLPYLTLPQQFNWPQIHSL